jgi:hypothetical protein
MVGTADANLIGFKGVLAIVSATIRADVLVGAFDPHPRHDVGAVVAGRDHGLLVDLAFTVADEGEPTGQGAVDGVVALSELVLLEALEELRCIVGTVGDEVGGFFKKLPQFADVLVAKL